MVSLRKEMGQFKAISADTLYVQQATNRGSLEKQTVRKSTGGRITACIKSVYNFSVDFVFKQH